MNFCGKLAKAFRNTRVRHGTRTTLRFLGNAVIYCYAKVEIILQLGNQVNNSQSENKYFFDTGCITKRTTTTTRITR